MKKRAVRHDGKKNYTRTPYFKQMHSDLHIFAPEHLNLLATEL